MYTKPRSRGNSVQCKLLGAREYAPRKMSLPGNREMAQIGNLDSPSTSQQPASQTAMNYAGAASTENFPKKEQAIVMDVIEETTLKDYVSQIAKLTSPTHIRFASRISNNRVCIYLATKEIADTLIEKHKTIKIGNTVIEIKPLITRAKRVILSNVCPVIPHSVLQNILLGIGVKLESKISFIKAGMADPGFAHIMSFRRQVYVRPTDIPKIPDSFQVQYEDTKYWVFASSDSLACFLCKTEGHLARNCPANVNNQTIPVEQSPPSQSEINNTIISENSGINPTNMEETSIDLLHNINNREIQAPEQIETDKIPIKRPLSISTAGSIINSKDLSGSQSSLASLQEGKYTKENKKDEEKIETKSKNKKAKLNPNSDSGMKDLHENLNTVKEIIEDPAQNFPLDFLSFKSFFDKAVGNPLAAEVAVEYTNDIESISKMMRELYPNLPTRSLKVKFTKIIKLIELSLPQVSDSDNANVNTNIAQSQNI